jgi:type II secretory pathway pseudopilin PulG
MVVVAIIGVLGAALLPQVTGLVEKAKASKMVGIVDSLKTACASYFSDTGAYAWEYAAPWYTGAGNHRLSLNPGVSGWAGPYLQSVLDRGSNPYNAQVWVYSTINNWGTAGGTAGFDLDGNGTSDTPTNAGNYVIFYNIPLTVAQKVNDMIDGDSATNANWQITGQVEYMNNYYVAVYLVGGR